MQKRVLLLATTTGYQIRMFGEAAERLGAKLVFATDRCDQLDDPWWDGAIPVRFHQENSAVEAIVAAARRQPLDGIVAVGDRPTVVAALAARALALPWHPPNAARLARDKRHTRKALRSAGLKTPWFLIARRTTPVASLAPASWPVVVKPTVLSGSRGVIRANDMIELRRAFTRVARLLDAPDVRALQDSASDDIVIEQFIEGREYALDGIVDNGQLRTLAIFDKPDPLDGPYFEETLYVTPARVGSTTRDAIESAIARAIHALGLQHGPVHAECRVNDRGVYVLEVAARPIGGLCARALRLINNEAQTIGLEELILRHALGESPSRWARSAGASGVMMIPIPAEGIYRGVEGIESAREVGGIDDVQITAKPDQHLVPLPEGASYLGFIFARADTPDAVEQALRDAHRRLRFTVDRAIVVNERQTLSSFAEARGD
jgi:biotin carboxylase